MIIQNFMFQPQLIAPIIVIGFLIYFVLKYFVEYRAQAKRLLKHLNDVKLKVGKINGTAVAEQRAALSAIFRDSELSHSWQEYAETLHNQYQVRDGENHITRIRSTAPAAYFFSIQKVIETPLKTEYFKHLPGILTGIGIIGTFGGLMLGLHHFNPSNPARVQESVTNLLNDVLYAFGGSMSSIVVAMFITNSEKNNLRKCISALEQLTEAIDSIFDAGVGEEYLAELVRHTQESSAQTRMLKDSLVTDLREMLQNLVDTQVRENLNLAQTLSTSYQESGRDIATQISAAIETSFREPLDQLAKSVQMATNDQSGNVQSLLQEVLVAFMQKLEGTFGNQFTGMQEMLQQSITSMQQMQGMFSGLVQDMRAASESSSHAIQSQLAKTLADMHDNQQLMQTAMNDMIVSLQSAVVNIGAQGEQAGGRMGEQIERIFAESEARQEAMAAQMQTFVDTLKESVGKGQDETMQRISASVEQLSQHLGEVMQNFDASRKTMDSASGKAFEMQQEQMARTLAEMRTHQSTLQENLAQGQNDAMVKITATVDDLGGKLHGIVTNFEKNRHAMDEQSLVAQQQLQASTTSHLETLSVQVKSLLTALQQGQEANRQTIKLLGEQTDRSVAGLERGADKVNVAMDAFTTAGKTITDISSTSAHLAGQIQGSATELGAASKLINASLGDYRQQVEAMAKSIALIEGLVANAQIEGGMRSQVLADMKAVSERMRVLNLEANEFLERVTGVIGKSFDSFGTGIEKSLSRSLASFDAELERAIKALGGGVQELADNLETFGDIVEKSTRSQRAA